MIRSLIRLALLLGVVALIYYRFFGTEAEKAQSKEVITKGTEVAKNLGKMTYTLLKRGKENLDSGKYDDTLDNISTLIDDLKEKAKTLEESKEIYDQIKALENKKDEIQRDLAATQVASYDDNTSEEDKTAAKEDIKNATKELLKETEALMNQLEKE